MSVLDELSKGLTTSSPEETEALGERLAIELPDDSALALQGDLGAGKTTFVRGIARGLGIKAEVTSPTYTIYTIYDGNRQLLHMDAYRLASAHELESLTIEEFLKSPSLMVVEWPENVPEFLDDYETTWIKMEILPDHRHRISLRG